MDLHPLRVHWARKDAENLCAVQSTGDMQTGNYHSVGREECDKVKVHWATDIQGIGNQYGFSVHDREGRKALAAAGVELCEPEDCDMHIVVGPPHGLHARPGKRVVLYTAWEALDMPPAYIAGLRNADVIVVPSRFLIEVCEKYTADLATPVHYCPLGVDVDTFTPPLRKRDPQDEGRFRWLWCGAPNVRKGWDAVRAMIPIFDEMGAGKMELYFKTTIGEGLKRFKTPSGMQVIVDSRNLNLATMASLYQGAHGFLYPTRGEGFGLTLAEAMSTGLPCIYTPWSACTDLADNSCAYPLRFTMEPADMAPNLSEDDPRFETFRVTSALPKVDLEHMVELMTIVMGKYKAARRRGKRAARRIREHFTWGRTGARLREILEKEASRVRVN